jgi:hypothetical protein
VSNGIVRTLLSLLFLGFIIVGMKAFLGVEDRILSKPDEELRNCWPSEASSNPKFRPTEKLTGRLHGSVLDDRGMPVPYAELELLPLIPNKDNDWDRSLWDMTNEKGDYNFPAVRVGQYYLAVQKRAAPDRQRPVVGEYYPGVESKTHAQLISVEEKANRSIPPFRLKRIPLVEIEVMIHFEDGLTPFSSHVLAYNTSFKNAIITSIPIERGRGKIILPVGFDYQVIGKVDCLIGHTIHSPESRPVQNVHVTEREHPHQIELVISGDACRIWQPN